MKSPLISEKKSTAGTEKSVVPSFFYGTAWKEEATADLTYKALCAGFRAIDTANQRKHYNEEGVGLGLSKFQKSHGAQVNEIFIQTKFTYARGQDHRKPYDENESFTKQVQDSFASSLSHLGVNQIDSYVLHGHFHHADTGAEDVETWQAMENLVDQNKTRFLGLSNTNAKQLRELYEQARIKPAFVQNRCFARLGWDKEVRALCREFDIKYQGFSLLTANVNELSTKEVFGIARRHKKQIPPVVFRFSQQIGIIPITGTTDPEHMQEDLDIDDFELTAKEIELLENLS